MPLLTLLKSPLVVVLLYPHTLHVHAQAIATHLNGNLHTQAMHMSCFVCLATSITLFIAQPVFLFLSSCGPGKKHSMDMYFLFLLHSCIDQWMSGGVDVVIITQLHMHSLRAPCSGGMQWWHAVVACSGGMQWWHVLIVQLYITQL